MIYTRHHSFPSPLLDWTASRYIAAYFAFRDASLDEDVAIYAYASAPEGAKAAWVGEPVITKLGRYVTSDIRHYSQQAEYTICAQFANGRWSYTPHEIAFANGTEEQDLLRKFTLPGSPRREVLAHLDEMNINDYTLFGTEDGLMTALANRECYFRDT